MRPVLAASVLLLVGIWAGAHPSVLPGPLADALGASDGRVVADAIDKVDAAYIGLREVAAGLRVQRVLPDSPAARAGVLCDDVIVAADGRSLAGRPTDVATALVKGPAGSKVRLRLRRADRTLTKRVQRATISAPVVKRTPRRAAGRRVAQIALSTFTSGAHDQVADAIRAARERGARGIVLDLRGNGGGLAEEAQRVAGAADDPDTARDEALRAALKTLGAKL